MPLSLVLLRAAQDAHTHVPVPGGSLTASMMLPVPIVASICRFSCSPCNGRDASAHRETRWHERIHAAHWMQGMCDSNPGSHATSCHMYACMLGPPCPGACMRAILSYMLLVRVTRTLLPTGVFFRGRKVFVFRLQPQPQRKRPVLYAAPAFAVCNPPCAGVTAAVCRCWLDAPSEAEHLWSGINVWMRC